MKVFIYFKPLMYHIMWQNLTREYHNNHVMDPLPITIPSNQVYFLVGTLLILYGNIMSSSMGCPLCFKTMGRNTSPNSETTAILWLSTIPRWWKHPITINIQIIKNLFASQLPPTCPYGYQLDRHKQIFRWKLEWTPEYTNACVRGVYAPVFPHIWEMRSTNCQY